jgi:anthranilate phosphoribosyltransferase
MIREAIATVVDGEDLSRSEAEGVMSEIMRGEATPSQISAFITALRVKGETVDEIAGCAKAMRAHARKVVPKQKRMIDTCGTGGDRRGTFNISTITAFVVAGAGVAVAKHGNRSVSSQCGSADVLEALGAKIELTPEQMAQCIDEVGIGFLFAPSVHPAMKHAAGPRREVGIRTIFNILGPLTNPASASVQLLGVYDPKIAETIAQVLGVLGVSRALVVHGAHGLDELSTTGSNRVTRLCEGNIRSFRVNPGDVGFPKARVEQLKGGTAEDHAEIVRNVLQGEEGVRRHVVLLNAGAALAIAGETAQMNEGIAMAAEAIDSGKALQKLEQLIELSRSF